MPRRTKRSRHLSALKGWRTRRANARQRSEAAKRGWETRRRDERARQTAKRKRVGAKRRGASSEFVVHFDYGSKRKGNVIRVQVHLIGPANASDREAIAATREFFEHEEEPAGWKVRVIKWRKQSARTPGQIADAATALRFAILGKASVRKTN